MIPIGIYGNVILINKKMSKNKSTQEIINECWATMESLIETFPSEEGSVPQEFVKKYNAVLDKLTKNPGCGFRDLDRYKISVVESIDPNIYKQTVVEFYRYFKGTFNILCLEHPTRDFFRFIVWEKSWRWIKENKVITGIIIGVIVGIILAFLK